MNERKIPQKQVNDIQISISREHKEYLRDVKSCFKDLTGDVEANHLRKSAEMLPISIVLSIGTGLVGAAIYDLLKLGIKKLFRKFRKVDTTLNINVTVRYQGIMHSIDNQGVVRNVIVPQLEREFQHIKTLDDLLEHIQRINSKAKQNKREI